MTTIDYAEVARRLQPHLEPGGVLHGCTVRQLSAGFAVGYSHTGLVYSTPLVCVGYVTHRYSKPSVRVRMDDLWRKVPEDTRTLRVLDPARIAVTTLELAIIALRRAREDQARDERRVASEREATAAITAIFGTNLPLNVEATNAGSVRLQLGDAEVTCWPDEAALAARALVAFVEATKNLGRARPVRL